MLEIVGEYKVGGTFTCTKRRMVDTKGTLGAPCGTEVRMHGAFWAGQICPSPDCLATYHVGCGQDNRLRPSHGWYAADVAQKIRENIASNGGQYVPEF